MSNSLLYEIALTLIPSIGPVQARGLLEHFGDAAAVFKARPFQLQKVNGLGAIRSQAITAFRDFQRAEKEIRFVEDAGIRTLLFTDPGYPKRLLNCYDAPVLLYYKGTADLNTSKIIAAIGTRHHTEYGRQLTENFIKELSSHQVMVISGLAYGIDAIAHKAALKSGLGTVGVLAHGLDQVYPALHTGLAKDMISAGGGLLTEFPSLTKPDRHNFPTRNRIVAGISDAVIVMETGIKGGSIITAELANSYNRDVFAFPGRVGDPKSAGCNHLIKTNKAILLTDAAQLSDLMNWEEKKTAGRRRQIELFLELTIEEKQMLSLLEEKPELHIDELNLKSGLSTSGVAAAILSLELRNLVVSLPGKRYRLS